MATGLALHVCMHNENLRGKIAAAKVLSLPHNV